MRTATVSTKRLQPATIDGNLLRAIGACRKQVKVFEKLWPNGVHLTREVIEVAKEQGLDVAWFASNASAPAASLKTLATDSNAGVRASAAMTLVGRRK